MYYMSHERFENKLRETMLDKKQKKIGTYKNATRIRKFSRMILGPKMIYFIQINNLDVLYIPYGDDDGASQCR